MNRQVIILCDLKINISFVQYIKSALSYWKEKCTVPCLPQSEIKHTHFIQRFLRKLGTIYNCRCLLFDDTVNVTQFSETPIYFRGGLKSAIIPKIKNLCFFLEGWTQWWTAGGVSHPSTPLPLIVSLLPSLSCASFAHAIFFFFFPPFLSPNLSPLSLPPPSLPPRLLTSLSDPSFPFPSYHALLMNNVYILFSPHNQKTIIFVILFFYG